MWYTGIVQKGRLGREHTMITSKNIQNVDQRIRDRLGNAYEVFEHEGSVYVNAPLDETEAESVASPTCVYVNEIDFFCDEDELYKDCEYATEEVDRLMVERESAL